MYFISILNWYLVKKENIISGIQNVIALGLSFISGCFVSPNLLDKNILNFSKLFPSYWYIDTNYRLMDIADLSFESLKPIFINYIVILLFGILFIILSKIVVKYRKS